MKKKIILLSILNAFFLVYFLHFFFPVDPYLLSLVSNLILFAIPGLAWSGVLKQRFYGDHFVADVITIFFVSVVILIVGLLGHLLLSIKVTPFTHFIYLLVMTNAGVLLSKDLRIEKVRPWKTVLFIFILCYTLSYMFSTYAANKPFQDSDLDLQGTSYGLIRHLTPRMLTDRKTIYNFSHPLIPAFCAANTILFFDKVDAMKYYYDASIKAEKIEQEEPFVGQKISFVSSDNTVTEAHITDVEESWVRLDSAITENVKYDWSRTLPEGVSMIKYNWIKKMKIWQIIEESYRRFYQNPHLMTTRSSQFFFAALTAVVFFLFSLKLTGSYPLSLFGSLLYLMIPEVFTSLSILAYIGPTTFILLSTAYLYHISDNIPGETKKGMNIPLFLTGFLCAVTNHKTVILIAAIVIRDCLAALRIKERGAAFRAVFKNNIVTGFGAGLLAFGAYGFIINADYFFLDHIQYHFLDRIFHRDVLGYGEFLSVGRLWAQYSLNLGIPLFVMALNIIVYGFKDVTKKDRIIGMLSLWFIIGAVSFSIVDHRLTSHLLYITPPLMILTVKWLSERKMIIRTPVLLILLYVLVIHLRMIGESVAGSRTISSMIHWLW